MALENGVLRYRLKRTLRGERLQLLFEFAARCGMDFSFVVRRQLPSNQNLRTLVERLRQDQLKVVQHVHAWPGTAMDPASTGADLYIFRGSVRVAKIFALEADSLWHWRQPDLPEDVALLRASGDPFFFSVTHERQAWLDATAEEIANLKALGLPRFEPLGKARSTSPAVPTWEDVSD